MTEKTEGTVVLDGLLEGKIPQLPNVDSRLREWVRAAASANLRFSLEISGGTFNILADNQPVAVADLAPAPDEAIANALDELLKVFPSGERAAVARNTLARRRPRGFTGPGPRREKSRVRQAHARSGTPDGKIETRQRSGAAQTIAPPRRLTRREIVRMASVGVIIAAVLFLISWIFIPYGRLFDRVAGMIWPVNVDSLKVDLGGFGDYFTVEKKRSAGGG